MGNSIKNVLNKINIVEVISNYIDLIQKGKNYWGICPFHIDNKPSLSVSKEKKIFKCFSCNHSGNSISFVMDFKKINYFDAIKEISEILGIKIDINEKKIYSDKDKYFILMNNFASNLYHNNLMSEMNKDKFNYLIERKIPLYQIKKFQLGFATNSNNELIQIATNQNNIRNLLDNDENVYTVNDLIDNKLAIYDKKSQPIDFFRNRIIFPIFDKYNNVIGFSGRDCNLESSIKYLNTSSTDLFKKESIFYNIQNLNSSFNEVYIVEGFMDLFALDLIGIPNVLATMGVNLSNSHIQLLKNNNVKYVTLCFDNDSAGKNATIKTALKILENGLDVFVIEIKTNHKDFNEILIESESLLREQVKYKIDIVLFYIKHKLSFLDKNDLKKSLELFDDCIDMIKKFGKFQLVNKYIEELKEFGLNSSIDSFIYDFFNKNSHKKNIYHIEVPEKYKPSNIVEKKVKQLKNLIKNLIDACLRSKEWFNKLNEDEYVVSNEIEEDLLLFKFMREYYKKYDKSVLNNLNFIKENQLFDFPKIEHLINKYINKSINLKPQIEYNEFTYNETISAIKKLEFYFSKKEKNKNY